MEKRGAKADRVIAIFDDIATSMQAQPRILRCQSTDTSDIAVVLEMLVSRVLLDIGSPHGGAIRFDIDRDESAIAAAWHPSADTAIAAQVGAASHLLKLEALRNKGLTDAARGALDEFDYDCHLAIAAFVEGKNAAAEKTGESVRCKYVVQWVGNLLSPFEETGH